MRGSTLLNPKSKKRSAAEPKEILLSSFDLPIGGVTSFSTVDYPGNLAVVLYTQGCSWRCRYCHNPSFRSFKPKAAHRFLGETLPFLVKRKGLLDAVVFSGGEPTCHQGLGPCMKAVKSLGYKVALHTSGMFPNRLGEVLSYCDWVSVDIKAPFDQYEKITQVEGSGKTPRESVEIILESGVDYEFHTIFHPNLLSEEGLLEIGRELSLLGVQNYRVKAFHPEGCPDESLNKTPLPKNLISEGLRTLLEHLFKDFLVVM